LGGPWGKNCQKGNLKPGCWLLRTHRNLQNLKGAVIVVITRDNVIDFIKRLSARTEISPLRLVDWMELSRSKYYEWGDR
jgi:hypothetical protein